MAKRILLIVSIILILNTVFLLISVGCSSFSHQNENKELSGSANERTYDKIGDKIIDSYTVGNETLTIVNGTTIVEDKQKDCFFIKFNEKTLGPFDRFLSVDKDNNMSNFTVKEINGKLFFIVFATKPVSWGQLGLRGSTLIIGYNGDIYYPYHDNHEYYYDITSISQEIVYIKKENEINDRYNHYIFRLYKGLNPISKEYEEIIPLKLDANDDIYYYGEPYHDLSMSHHSEKSEICKNETTLFKIDIDFDSKEDVSITSNNNFYYISYDEYSLYRNDEKILTLGGKDKLSTFIVSKDENNIACVISHNNGDFSLLKNGNLVYKSTKSNEFITSPILSPDGLKLYYFDAFIINNRYLIYYIRGPGVPPAISGPYLRPSWWSVNFSNDSKYVAYVLEGFERGMDGICIILNSMFLGPYISIRNEHFSGDSKKYIYEYKDSDGNWVENIIDL